MESQDEEEIGKAMEEESEVGDEGKGDADEMKDKVRENTEQEEEMIEYMRGSTPEPVINDGDDGLRGAINNTAIDSGKEYIVISHHTLPECLFDAEKEKAKWLAYPDLNLNATTEKIKEILRSENPKNILVLAYQKFVGSVDVTTLEKHMNEISRLAMESVHQLGFGCFYYTPQFERIWNRNTQLNMHVRLLNLNMGISPCNLHKSFLISYNKGRVFYVRPNLFAEYVEDSGVGETLSSAGYVRVRDTSLKYIYNAFEDQERPVNQALAKDVEPPPLFLSPGYKNRPSMQKFIKDSGLRQPSRSNMVGSGDRRASADGNGGSRGQSRRGRGRGRGRWNSNAPRAGGRVKIKSNLDQWTSEDDMTEDELREHRRQKLSRYRYGPDADELASRLKELKLKGVKEGQKTRQKENSMARKIKEMEKELNEKDKKIKEQRDRLRENRDNEKRNTDLRDDIKNLNRKIRGLKDELVDAQRGMDDYRDAYERLCDGIDNKRRKK